MTQMRDDPAFKRMISTHILTRRMTSLQCTQRQPSFISTHILTRRMTVMHLDFRVWGTFQLTSSRGGWPWWTDMYRTSTCISTHILTRRMTSQRTPCIASLAFQLTSSRGGWRKHLFFISYINYFNSHPHEEDDEYGLICSKDNSYFNSHPHEEDDSASHLLKENQQYFNSHPHEEDDNKIKRPDFSNVISTHILTRRMTRDATERTVWIIFQLTSSRGGWQKGSGIWKRKNSISTHILTRRMTYDIKKDLQKDVFQLTSSRGGWRVGSSNDMGGYYISTHILTRRMTTSCFCWFLTRAISTHILTRRMTTYLGDYNSDMSFQLTSSRGGWHGQVPRLLKDKVFQLTSSRGGWLRALLNRLIRKYFNSHPHEEDDNQHQCYNFSFHISTHILTRRMTVFSSNLGIRLIFQLTSSRGGWRTRLWCIALVGIFQLTSSRGGWLLRLSTNISATLFQLTSSRGGWRNASGSLAYV